MPDNPTVKPHWSFWLIGAIALLWNGGGAANYIMQMDPENLEMYRQAEQAIITSRPAWATAGFAVSVFAGALGAILLLARRSAAFYLFALSLLGTVVVSGWTLSAGIEFSGGEMAVIVLGPLLVSVILVWFAALARKRGWTR